LLYSYDTQIEAKLLLATLTGYSVKCSPYSVKLLVPWVTLKVDLIFEEHVGIDIHKKHVVSREDDLHVTKAYGSEKPKPLSSLPADICSVSSRTARTSPAQAHIGRSPLSKEVCVIEDDDDANVPDKADNMPETRTFNNLASLEIPSFDLMLEEDNGDMQDVSFPEPAKAECRGATSSTIFDHIRKKSRDFPTLMLSKSMNSSYEPLILKKMKTSRDQFNLDQGILHANEVTPMDSEHSELRVSPTNTAEKCRMILSRTSEKSRSLFAEKVYSPFEKSESLNRIPDENSVQFADRRGSLSEKSKSLGRIPDENSVQFTVRTDSLSEKTKILWTAADENSHQFLGKRDSPSEKSKSLSRITDENSVQFAVRADSLSEKTKILWTAADENSHQFAGKRDSPSEKSKILVRPPDDSTRQFEGRRGSPSEKMNVLSRTPDENGLQFAAKRDSSSAKSNVLSKTPDVDSSQFAGRRDNPSEKNKLCSSSPFPDFQAMSKLQPQFSLSGFKTTARIYWRVQRALELANLSLVSRVSFPSSDLVSILYRSAQCCAPNMAR